ncbi:MAG: DUF5104 domain-containing protein [Clostridiales bacterium]|nr:DUF5104 domain-containing protein [Clostridiales bacterium]
MKLIKVSSLIMIILISLSLAGCSRYNDDSLIADKRLNSIISALEKKDAEALKSMFSKEAMKEADNIDYEIEYVMQFFDGKIISQDGNTSSSEQMGAGGKQRKIRGSYIIKTDVDIYNIFFIEKRNTGVPDENGLYAFHMIKYSKGIETFYWMNKRVNFAGVLSSNPEILEPEDYINGNIRIFDNQDNTDLKSLFSKNAVSKTSNLDKNINNATELYQGKMTSFNELNSSVETVGDNVILTSNITIDNEINK